MSYYDFLNNEEESEFHIQIATTFGNYFKYAIEADSLDDAMNIAEEIFTNDYPDAEIEEMWWVEEDD